jgi:hypothetical protein
MVKRLIVPITIYIAVSIFMILLNNHTFSSRGGESLTQRHKEHKERGEYPLFPLRLCDFVPLCEICRKSAFSGYSCT